MLEKSTMGAAASKKCSFLPPMRRSMAAESASDVSGPDATMVTPSSGSSQTSVSTTVMFGCLLILSVIYAEKPVLSTASALPAGTAVASAASIIREPRRRISSFKSPTAFDSSPERSELEQTSSAKFSLWCAGVNFFGFISQSVTSTPRSAACHAASQPASPAPIILIFANYFSSLSGISGASAL